MATVALLGAGFIGNLHAANLAVHPHAELSWVFDPQSELAKLTARKYHGIAASSARQVFADPSVDAVIIASTTDSHAELLDLALEHQKPVLVEMPLTTSALSGNDYVKRFTDAHLLAMPDLCRRFAPNYIQLRTCICDDSLGDIELLQISSRGISLSPFENYGHRQARLRERLFHFFDLATWLLNSLPVDIYAASSRLEDDPSSPINTCVATLRFANGALCQLDASMRDGLSYDERVAARGSIAAAETQRGSGVALRLHQTQRSVKHYVDADWLERITPIFASSLEGFLGALESEETPPASLQDAVVAQVITQAFAQSLTEERPVPFNWNNPLGLSVIKPDFFGARHTA